MSTYFAFTNAIIDLMYLELVAARYREECSHEWPPRIWDLQAGMETFTHNICEVKSKAYTLFHRYAINEYLAKPALKSAMYVDLWTKELQGFIAYTVEKDKQFMAAYHALPNKDYQFVFPYTTRVFNSLPRAWASDWEDVELGYIYTL